MAQDRKRQERQEKKAIKREGNRRARRQLARGLREHPDEAQYDEVDFGMARSEPLNGEKRKRTARGERGGAHRFSDAETEHEHEHGGWPR